MADNLSLTFGSVTETPGVMASQEQIQRIYNRYKFVADLSIGKRVLEVACGVGQGLGLLARVARDVVGVDIDLNLVSMAQKQYAGRSNIFIDFGDAQQLAFADDSFDVVFLYEAIYYLSSPEKFVKEAKRVLKKNGFFLICTANKDVPGFNPSPFSNKYFSAYELSKLLKDAGFHDVELFGDSPLSTSLKDNIINLTKMAAVKFQLMPKTMKGKEWLKRVFMGKLYPMPAEIPLDFCSYQPPQPINQEGIDKTHKVLFVSGKLN